MKRPIFLFTTALCFALIAFIAGNVIYFNWIKNYQPQALKQPEVIQVDSLHSAIPENNFKKDSLLAWLPSFKDRHLFNWIDQHPDCKVTSSFDHNKNNWVWAYVITDNGIVVLATIDDRNQIITSL